MRGSSQTPGAGRPQPRRAAVGALACLALLPAAPAGAAVPYETSPRADFRLKLGSQRPASPSTMTLHFVYKAAGDPEAKPSPIRRVVIQGPSGMRYGLSRVAACPASNEQLRAQGEAACPAASRVGTGSLSAITGFGPPVDPVLTDATIFNTGEGFVELVKDRNSGAPLATDRATVTGSRAVLVPPHTPGGPPDGQTAVRQIDFRFDRARYVITPPTCPPSGAWRSRGEFTYADGVTAVVASSTPCLRSARPRMNVVARPRRARLRRPTRVRFRVRSFAPRCVRGVTVRVGRRRARTNRRGRASVVARFQVPGRRVVVAHKPGCVTDRAWVRVRRP